MNLTKHHILYPILGVVVLFLGLAWLRSHDAWKDMQADLRVATERVKLNNTTIVTQSKVVSQAETSNKTIDLDTQRKLASLQAQLSSKPDSAQIQAIVKAAIPSLRGVISTTDNTGQAILSVPDTQENRDAINKTDVAFKSCRFELDGCTAKQANYLIEIEALKATTAAQKDTIDTQAQSIRELKSFGKGGNFLARTTRVAVPVLCAVGGAYLGASRGPKAGAIGAAAGGLTCAFAFRK